MIINYDIFYRRFGLRRVQQLITPQLGMLEAFQLPRAAILHSAHGDTTKFGPIDNDLAFRGIISAIQTNGQVVPKSISRPVLVQHITTLDSPIGHPIKVNVIPMNMIRQYHLHYRRFRRITNIEQALADRNSLIVYNYDLLLHLFRYPRTFFNQYFEWCNIERTMWDTIGKAVTESDRQHFIVRTLPTVLPARSSFVLGARMSIPSRRVLTLFNTPEHLFLLELWKWFGPDRESSMMSAIPRDKLKNMNIIFQESGKWTVLNLGLLDSWRKPMPEEMTEGEVVKDNLIEPSRFQIRGLRFLMSLSQIKSVAPDVISESTTQSFDKDDRNAVVKQLAASHDDTVGHMVVHKIPDEPAKKDPVTGIISTPTATLKVEVPNDIDEPEDTPDSVKQDADLEAQIDKDIAELENISNAVISSSDSEEIDKADSEVETHHKEDNTFNAIKSELKEKVNTETVMPDLHVKTPPDVAIMNICKQKANDGLLSAAQMRQYDNISKSYKRILAVDNVSTLEEFINIPPEALKIHSSIEITDIDTVVDKSMLKSSLLNFDEKYVKEVLHRDVASAVMSIQNAGIVVTAYDVERNENIMGAWEMNTVRVVPIEGASSTLRFKLPVIDPDGTYVANGVKYTLRKQKIDVPIRKTASDIVALTSYYGKIFVKRSSKKVNDYANWLLNNIMAKHLNHEDLMVLNAHPLNVFDNLFTAPRLYSILASGFKSFLFCPTGLPAEFDNISFNMMFDHTKREATFGKDILKQYELNGAIVVGIGGFKNDIYMLFGKHSTVGIAHNGKITPVSSFDELLGLDRQKAPIDFCTMNVSGETIPVGVVLGYLLGLNTLINLLKAEVRRVPAGKRLELLANEYALVFNDESLILNRDDHLASMFLAGFNEYHRTLKQYNSYLFNKRDVYFNVLDSINLGVRYLREMDLISQMFIDPITRDLLIEMKEPTDIKQLLLRAGSMLINDDHPDLLNATYMRIRGYERIAGAVYSELVRTIRSHNGKPGKSRLQLDMSPFEIWKNIQSDPAKTQVMDINPIQNLKEKEAVTYNGTGGRNSRTMTKKTRSYHENDMGTISGDTVDSSDVAINIYTSADPQFTSLRGISKRYNKEEMGATPLLSTSALLAVGSDNDDPKRVNFIGIQNTHGVSCNGYHQMAVRTGYEQVIAHRTSDLYSAAAIEDGKVLSITPTGVLVEYASGEKKGYEIGTRYGNAAGLTIPHDVIPNVSVGSSFKKGDILTYNKGFFEKDILNPKNVIWKAGVLAKVALMEVGETIEDSSAISQRIADKLQTRITKIIPVVISFNQEVRKVLKIGTVVNSEDILCILEDTITSSAGLFNEETLDTLRILGNQTPQAKTKGTIERIEVFYNGDKEDMSPSLRALADESDKELAKRLRSIGKPVLTGVVDDGFRIEGDPLPMDSLAIRFFISSTISSGSGDKGVFANQMKSVFCNNFEGNYRTESGEEIDAIFGNQSIEARIVLSPYIIGTTNVLLDLIGKKAAKAYRDGK